MKPYVIIAWLLSAGLAAFIAVRTIPPLLAQPAPASNSSAVVELGRLLFWDPILSGSQDTACVTCHHPDFGYADGRALSLGTGSVGLGENRRDTTSGRIPVVRRNSPTVLNVAFNGADDGGRRGRRQRFDGTPESVNQADAPMFWDSRLRSLELQALEPIKAFEEMRGTAYAAEDAVAIVVDRLRDIPEYVTLFEQAFGPGATITGDRLGRAIAAFERSLVAMNSPFDRYRAGDTAALDAQQLRGMEAFEDADCDRCHEGPMLSDFDLHAEGVPEHPMLSTPDAGDGRFRFRTPTLRNIELTAPYMHNGTFATLEDVLRFYDRGRSENPNVANTGRGEDSNGLPRLSRDFRRVEDMSNREMEDIIAFLKALTDPGFDRIVPQRVPSGLQPGGMIRNESPAANAR